MRTLIRGVSFWDGMRSDVVETGCIVIRDGLIEAVSEGVEPPGPFDETVDGRGKLALPGFVNTHGHPAMSLLRGYADDMPLETWLTERIWPAEEAFGPGEVRLGTELAMLEMIETGTTTFTDMYFHMGQVAEAALSAGMRAVLCRGLVSFSPSFETALAESADLLRDYHGAGDGRITVTLGPHAPHTCLPDALARIYPLAEKWRVPVQIHVAETAGETAESLRVRGRTPVQVIEQAGLLAYPVIAAHCVHVTESDIETLAGADVRIAHNPGSNLKLGSGIAPLTRFLAAGLTVGLGTDGAASNNKLDMCEEVRLAALLHKGIQLDATAIDARTALRLATSSGARVLHLAEGLGTLAKGSPADIQLLDISGPRYFPRHDLLAHTVYSSSGTDVTDVFVAGRALYRNRTFTTLDRERILREAEAFGRRLRPSQQSGGAQS